MCLYEAKQVDSCSRMRHNHIKKLYFGCAKYARGYGGYVLSTSSKVLFRRDCALSAKALEVVLYMLEVLEGVFCVLELLWGGLRRVLEAVENCALYAVSTAGDALCAALYAGGYGGWALLLEVLEVVEVAEVKCCVLQCML